MSYSDSEYDDLDDDGYDDEWYPEFYDDAKFNLFEAVGGDAQVHGSLKSYETKDGGLVYYRDDRTGFTISVERLLQADGYAESSKKERRTLFVLGVVLACNSRSRIKQAIFNIHFDDLPEKRGRKIKADSVKVQPEVVAWAPFNTMVKTNEVFAERSKWKKTGLELKREGSGIDAKATAEWENTITWTESYWETAHSFATFGSDQRRNGVRWVLNANPKDTQGLPPKLTIGVMLSRQSDEPYLINFDIKVTGGPFNDLLKGIEKMLGRKPETTKPYKVAPSKEPLWRATGFRMMNRVNLHSMLDLQGKEDNLVLVWDEEDKEESAVASNPQ